MPGPLLNVNNKAENCANSRSDHTVIFIMKLLSKPWSTLEVYKCADEETTVTIMVISNNEPAVTGFPVVSAARSWLDVGRNPNISIPKCWKNPTELIISPIMTMHISNLRNWSGDFRFVVITRKTIK